MIGLALLAAAAAVAEAPHIEPINDRADILVGSGCNIVIVRSDKGLLLVDDQRPGDYAETMGLLRGRYSLPVRQVLNTHFHLDHSGGNAFFARDGAVVTAQRNVQQRLGDANLNERYRKRYPDGGTSLAPTQIFDTKLNVQFGAERIVMLHIPNAHTDGDALVKLELANVLHTGDLFFTNMYPHIDTDAGGSIQGNIKALTAALRMTNARSRIVPGHGAVVGQKEIREYRAMLIDVMHLVEAQIAAGRSLSDILATHPVAHYGMEGDADQFVTAVYQGVSKTPVAPKPQ
jgi:cyclase